MGETIWQKAYDEYVQDNSYQGKLKKENDRLKAKLDRIEQIIDDCDLEAWEVLKTIKETLEKE